MALFGQATDEQGTQDPIPGFPEAEPLSERDALIGGIDFAAEVRESVEEMQADLDGSVKALTDRLTQRLTDLTKGQSAETVNHILGKATSAVSSADLVSVAREGSKALVGAIEAVRPAKPTREPKVSPDGTVARRGRPKGSGKRQAKLKTEEPTA